MPWALVNIKVHQETVKKKKNSGQPGHMLKQIVKHLHVANGFPKGETYSWILQNYKHTVEMSRMISKQNPLHAASSHMGT